MKLFTLIIFISFINSFALATEGKTTSLADKIKKGNELYEQQEYSAAQKLYAEAQVDNPDNPVVNFNQGNVFYKQKKYTQAIAAYKKALELPTKNLESKALYNIGNCLVQQGKLKDALEFYKRAIKFNRNDKDIKYNIEYVQRKLKELQKKKKKKKKDDLNKLLKQLEKLIAKQAKENIITKKVIEEKISNTTNQQNFISQKTNILTNQQNYAKETVEIREKFKDLRTNLPPAKLYGQPNPQGMQVPNQQIMPQQNIQTPKYNLNSQANQLQPQGTQGNLSAPKQKTLAEKIDNAVKFLATARDELNLSVNTINNNITNTPPHQKTGLKYLIKARKEFDDKNKKGGKNNQQKQKQQKNKKKQNKNKKQKQDKQKQNKQKKQKQDKNKQNKQQPKPKPKQQKQKLKQQQVKQMLKNFKEDQKNKRKKRLQKIRATGYIPVDKDW